MSRYLNSIKRLVDKNGNSDLSLITYSQTIDPSNPLKVINSSSTESIDSYQGHYKIDQIDNEVIKSEDIKLYIDPSSVSTEPSINDKVTDGTVTYNIKSVKKWKSGSTTVLYVLQLRS